MFSLIQSVWILNDGVQILSKIVQNIVLLFALVFLYGATNIGSGPKKIKQKLFIGLIIGVFAFLIMLTPWTVQQGVIIDTRSALLVVSGVFFGPLTTLVAVLVSGIYRITLGGEGMYTGLAIIILSANIGLLWPRIRKSLPKMPKAIEYYILGLLTHIVGILCFLLIPWPLAFSIIKLTYIPFLAIFPIVTMFLALSLDNQRIRLKSIELIKNQKVLLQSSLDSTSTMEIFVLDFQYQYLAFNDYHKNNMLKYNEVFIDKNMNYLECIDNEKMRNRIKYSIDQALQGTTYKQIVEVEFNKSNYIEESYTPIINDKNEVTGVTIFSEDVTQSYLHQQSILKLSYRDYLTNLYNRRYYSEELERLDNSKYYPLSIIIADINGLKIMNDAFGHDMGDKLLIQVADLLISEFKKDIRVTRIGGDEFIILLPNTSKEHALSQVANLKESIESHKVMDMTISVSFGVATKIEDETISDIVKAAEDDMYTHKLFEIKSHRNETIKAILKTLHEKNPREEMHSARVSELCKSIGVALKMTDDELNLLKLISELHDIGKIAIDDSILNKPGKLNDKEWEVIKKHPEIGYRILSATPEYSEIAQDILSHHERYDGKGYPRGLKGDEIPVRAKIIAIADAFDAMISDRPYRKAMTSSEAIEEIKRNTGTQFDPTVAKIFIDLFEEIAI